MDQWQQKMRPRPSAPPPRLEHVTTLFRMAGTSRRAIRCAVCRVYTGTELRLEYDAGGDLLRSQLFKVHNEDAIAELADAWHLALVNKGFEEL